LQQPFFAVIECILENRNEFACRTMIGPPTGDRFHNEGATPAGWYRSPWRNLRALLIPL